MNHADQTESLWLTLTRETKVSFEIILPTLNLSNPWTTAVKVAKERKECWSILWDSESQTKGSMMNYKIKNPACAWFERGSHLFIVHESCESSLKSFRNPFGMFDHNDDNRHTPSAEPARLRQDVLPKTALRDPNKKQGRSWDSGTLFN